jgi:hypothetical protein
MATFDRRVIESNRILKQYKGLLEQQRESVTPTLPPEGQTTNDVTQSASHLQNTYDVKEERMGTPSTFGNPSVTFGSLDEYNNKIRNGGSAKKKVARSILKQPNGRRKNRDDSVNDGYNDTLLEKSTTPHSKSSSAVSRRRQRGGKSQAKSQQPTRVSMTIESRSSAFKAHSINIRGKQSNQDFLTE